MKLHTASCSCGQLGLTTGDEPVRVSICHCLDCQRRSGSVFAVQARFPRDGVTITGSSSTWSRVGDEGGGATFHFCPRCGVIVYFVNTWDDAHLMVPVGVFADPDFPAPTVSVYDNRMHGWVKLPADIEHLA